MGDSVSNIRMVRYVMEAKNYPNHYKQSNRVLSRQGKVREINYTITFPKIYCLGRVDRHMIFTKKNIYIIICKAMVIDAFKDDLFARLRQGLFPGR